MLLYLKVLPEKYNPYEEEVDGEGYGRMFFDLLPCLLHAFTPMDVIDDDDTVFCCVGQYLFEVPECWLQTVVAIHKNKVNSGYLL